MKTLGLALLTVASLCSAVVVQTVITAGTTTADQSSTSFFVFLPLVNSSTATVDNVTVTAATLGSSLKATSPKLPFVVGNLAAGGFAAVDLHFPDKTLIKGKNYFITVQGTFLENGSQQSFQVSTTVAYGVASIFDESPSPVTVTPTLDTAHAVTQIVSSAKGGTLKTTGADGSIFTLVFPAKALVTDEQITMTRLIAVSGLPLRGGLLAGVDLRSRTVCLSNKPQL